MWRSCSIAASVPAGISPCGTVGAEADLSLPTGERADSDQGARFTAHLLVTRTLLAAGL